VKNSEVFCILWADFMSLFSVLVTLWDFNLVWLWSVLQWYSWIAISRFYGSLMVAIGIAGTIVLCVSELLYSAMW